MPTLMESPGTPRRRFDAPQISLAAAAALTAVAQSLAVLPGQPDAELMSACLLAGELWRRYRSAFYGPESVIDDEQRDLVIGPLWKEAESIIHSIADRPATTPHGHQARAAVVLSWSADAMLGARETAESRLALAFACDLLPVPEAPSVHVGC